MLEVTIQKRLGDFSLDVSLALRNELTAIFGPSGSGKSLTLQCIAGLLKPDSGRIVINDRVVFDSSQRLNLRPQERKVGYLFQNYALFPHLSVQDNIEYGLQGLLKEERKHRVKGMIATMRLEGLESRHPSELSGGQQQRVALARVLVTEPQLLLLDEPFSALDSPIRSRLHAELLQILRGLPITTILVTHDLSEAYTLSEKMIVYDAGRVLQTGPRDDVLRHPNSRRVARFTGTKNLFQGTVLRLQPAHMEVQVGNTVLHTPPAPYRPGEAIDLCIRPEEIMLVRPERATAPDAPPNLCRGEVVGEIAHGTTFTLQFKPGGDPFHLGRSYDLHIEVPSHVYYRLGIDSQKEWMVSLNRDSIHLIGRAEGR